MGPEAPPAFASPRTNTLVSNGRFHFYVSSELLIYLRPLPLAMLFKYEDRGGHVGLLTKWRKSCIE